MNSHYHVRFSLLLALSLLVLPALLVGQHHALIFAVEQYQGYPTQKVSHAIEDAVALGAVLSARFYFHVDVVENPTRADIRDKLEECRRRFVKEEQLQDGQLLVYFIGRGAEKNGVSYFLPADANPSLPNASALAWHELLAEVSQFNCKHILVAADAGHSSAIRPGSSGGGQPQPKAFLEKDKYEIYLQDRRNYPSRIMLALDPNKKRDSQGPSLTHTLREGLNWIAVRYAPVSMGRIKDYLGQWCGEVATTYSFQGDDRRSNFVFSRHHIQRIPQVPIDEDEELWEKVDKLNTYVGYSFFARKNPYSRHAAEAIRRMEQFPDDLTAADGRDWEVKGKTAGTILNGEDGFIRIRSGVFTAAPTEIEDGPPPGTAPELVVREFFLSPSEVTIAEFEAFCAQTGRSAPPRTGQESRNSPATQADWYDALEYCNWLSRKKGLEEAYGIEKRPKDPENFNLADPKQWIITFNWKANGYRLPTVAEWEYAACTFPNIGPVGKMGKAVQEWCWNWETFGYYERSDEVFSPRGPRMGAFRSIRGFATDRAYGRRPACVLPQAGAPTLKRGDLGFRVVRNGG